MELVEVFGSGFLEQDLQKHLVELVLIAGGEDIGEEELTACGRVEIHRQVLVDAVGTSLVVVEVDMIDGYALVARGDICGDDVVVFVPGALGCVGTVLVVEGQEILLVVRRVENSKGVCSLFHVQSLHVEQAPLDGLVHNLSTMAVFVGGIVELQMDAAAGRVVIVGEHHDLVGLYFIEMYAVFTA